MERGDEDLNPRTERRWEGQGRVGGMVAAAARAIRQHADFPARVWLGTRWGFGGRVPATAV